MTLWLHILTTQDTMSVKYHFIGFPICFSFVIHLKKERGVKRCIQQKLYCQ